MSARKCFQALGPATANDGAPKCVTVGLTTISQSLSAANRCRWSTQIGGIRRCKSVKCFERQQAELELDALLDRQPVEAVPQHMSDVVVLLCANE